MSIADRIKQRPEIYPSINAQQRFFQLVIIEPDGSEQIAEICVSEESARTRVKYFNYLGAELGRTMVARLLESPRLACDAEGQI